MQGPVRGAEQGPGQPPRLDRPEPDPAVTPSPPVSLTGDVLGRGVLRDGEVGRWLDSWADSSRPGGEVRPEAPALPALEVRQAGDGLAELPEVGGTFLGFELLAELGRGTFGRV